MSKGAASAVLAMAYTNDEDRDGKFTFEEFFKVMKDNKDVKKLILKISDV